MTTKILHRLPIDSIKVVYHFFITIGTPEQIAAEIIEESILHFEDNLTTMLTDNLADMDEHTMKIQFLKVSLHIRNVVYAQNEMASTVSTNTLHILKPLHKHIVGLRYLVNLSYGEIAEILDLDQKQVRKCMYEARRNYKTIFPACSSIS